MWVVSLYTHFRGFYFLKKGSQDEDSGFYYVPCPGLLHLPVVSFYFSCDKKVLLKTYDVITIMPFPAIVVLSSYPNSLGSCVKGCFRGLKL